MTWIVTGGAGYIGAHVLRSLHELQLRTVVVDDLSTGSLSVVPDGVEVVQASVLDTERLSAIMAEHDTAGVIHLAAKKAPAESVRDPLFYYRENVDGIASVLAAMRESGTHRLVLSSSSSVYGNTGTDLIDEQTPFRPESPYGQTKVISEWLVAAAAAAYDLSYVNLRYFNVAGAGAPELVDRGTANLIPMVFQALGRGEAPQVFGTDYDTPDGSCIRDYVHVSDLADVHALAATQLAAGPLRATYNVGTGTGNSVFEVLDVIAEVTGIDIEAVRAPRRPGDPVRVVGDVARIERELGWRAKHDLRAMVHSAWSGQR
jgi:UDP-glucose 4-epimerase